MNNIPNYNPNGTLFSNIEYIINKYLLNNVFTADLMEIASINTDNTINIKSILQNVDTAGNIIENNTTINNVNVLMIKGGQTSISFNCQVGDIGLYLSLKKDYSKYFSNQETTINNNILFSFSNGVFIPLQLNNITNTLIIKNGSGTIEIADTTINVNATNVNITATTAITGDATINGNSTITGITNSASYATTGGTGISGTFVDSPTNKYITFTNGIITAQG